ncbi:MAG: hypothetical protein IMZ52_01305 [Actinobacteria bacterium]|nr:hypothetical protein [Actinomycetota bacterium]MBE3121493.1 hypothetical protein [Thermoplasmata archaeon]
MLGKKSPEQIQAAYEQAVKEKQEYDNEQSRIVLEKQKKANNRKQLEHRQLSRQQSYQCMSPLPIRLMTFYAWLSKNWGLVTREEINSYIKNARLTKYFDSLQDLEGPEKPLRFTEENDLIE